jgi:hypothetical protein
VGQEAERAKQDVEKAGGRLRRRRACYTSCLSHCVYVMVVPANVFINDTPYDNDGCNNSWLVCNIVATTMYVSYVWYQPQWSQWWIHMATATKLGHVWYQPHQVTMVDAHGFSNRAGPRIVAATPGYSGFQLWL